ncbi:hypothetical protein HPB50_022770 [Hyalomma asiaticum]|uniref:Uncharacterized protein n=1 Tax=Hyalomma asiaticum TaxID=266040 RepID=A0ACB7TMN0_HYAAI|nr:hypothetical protein HPB50_022770 [Hyalomma asiaticum]
MRVKQRLLYHKQRDAFIGEVDYGVNFPKETTNEPVLANSLLCFVLNGLSVSFKIPVAYFFTRNCTGRELHMLMRHVLKEVEEIGFIVVRIVTDNHKINVLAMQLLCNGSLKHCTDHPGKPNRKLFLAFDQCHLIKNVRSQFLSRDIGKGGEISSNHLKSLYKMQQGSLVKPVRFLTRKHVFPTNMEKMNVQRAVQVFSPPVTAALKLLQEQAGHTCDASFAGVGPTVQFMDTVHRWFVLMDVSNCTQHMHQKNADCKQFESAGDEWLIWLETSFLNYLADLKSQCLAKNFLTKETYEGLKFVEVLLATRRRMHHPLKEAVNNAAEILREHKALMCSKPGHQENLLKLLLTKFFRPIFTNFALKATDKHDVAKVFEIKPLSRKTLKL